MPTISFEASIAAGKESVLRTLNEKYGYSIALEPLHRWSDVNSVDLLALTYQNQQYRHLLNNWIQLTLFQRDLYLDTENVVLTERSLYSNQYVFLRLACVGNNQQLYNFVHTELFKHFDGLYRKPEQIIYIDTPPEVCLERIRRRGRSYEQGITLEFLELLNRLHREWLIDKTHGQVPCPVHVLDGTQSIQTLTDQAKEIISSFV